MTRTIASGTPLAPGAICADSMSTAIAPVAASSARAVPIASRDTDTTGPTWTVRPARRSSPASRGADGQCALTEPSEVRTSSATTTCPGFTPGPRPPPRPTRATASARASRMMRVDRLACSGPIPVRMRIVPPGRPERAAAHASNRSGAATTSLGRRRTMARRPGAVSRPRSTPAGAPSAVDGRTAGVLMVDVTAVGAAVGATVVMASTSGTSGTGKTGRAGRAGGVRDAGTADGLDPSAGPAVRDVSGAEKVMMRTRRSGIGRARSAGNSADTGGS